MTPRPYPILTAPLPERAAAVSVRLRGQIFIVLNSSLTEEERKDWRVRMTEDLEARLKRRTEHYGR